MSGGVGITYAEQTPDGFDLWSAGLAGESPVLVAEDVSFEPIELVGFARKDRQRNGIPSLRGEDGPAAHVRLTNHTSVYLLTDSEESKLLVVRAYGPPTIVTLGAHLPGGEPLVDPRVHASTDGAWLLVSTFPAAGGDVLAVSLSAPHQVVNTTASLDPLAVDPRSLRVSSFGAWFVADGVLYRSIPTHSGLAQAVDLDTNDPILPELLMPDLGHGVVAVAEKHNGKRKIVFHSYQGGVIDVSKGYGDYSPPALDHPLGPWIAVASDGSHVAYREVKKDEHELHVKAVWSSEDATHLTDKSDFPAYIDSIGVLSFAQPDVICYFAGDQKLGEFTQDETLGAADMYAADLSDPSSPQFLNVTRTSGDLDSPFDAVGLLDFDEALVGPEAERIFLSREQEDGTVRLSCFRIDGAGDLSVPNEQVLATGLKEFPVVRGGAAGTALVSDDLESWPPFVQAVNKVQCSGDPAGAGIVRVRASSKADPFDDKAHVYHDALVPVGGVFELDAEAAGKHELSGDTWIHVLDEADQVLQTVKFHSSCSQDLELGDRFGASTLIDYEGKNEPEDGATDYCYHDSKVKALHLRYTAGDCSTTSHAQGSKDVDCEDDGALLPFVRVRVSDESDPEYAGAEIWFDDFVESGGEFLVDAAAAGENELDKHVNLHVFAPDGTLLQSVEFKADCSEPIQQGDVFGAFTVEACTLKYEPDWSDACLYGRPRKLTMCYTGNACEAVVLEEDVRTLPPLAQAGTPGPAGPFDFELALPPEIKVDRVTSSRTGTQLAFVVGLPNGSELPCLLQFESGMLYPGPAFGRVSPTLAFSPDDRFLVSVRVWGQWNALVGVGASGATLDLIALSEAELLPLSH